MQYFDSRIIPTLESISNELQDTMSLFQFQINDALTRLNCARETSVFLNKLLRNREIAEFAITCDESNNTTNVRENGDLVLAAKVDFKSAAYTFVGSFKEGVRIEPHFSCNGQHLIFKLFWDQSK